MKRPNAPPIPGIEGHWAATKKAPDLKSFGAFACRRSGCSKQWTSAHSRPDYDQACTRCKKWSRPVWMWVNKPSECARRDSDEESNQKNKKPHKHWLCEMCKEGVCTR